MREHERWIAKSASDLRAAEDSLKNNHYDWAVYQAQQAIEKALKAFEIASTGGYKRTHDVYELAISLRAPNEIKEICQKVVGAENHVAPRYPNMWEEELPKEEVKERLEGARRVIEWVKGSLEEKNK